MTKWLEKEIAQFVKRSKCGRIDECLDYHTVCGNCAETRIRRLYPKWHGMILRLVLFSHLHHLWTSEPWILIWIVRCLSVLIDLGWSRKQDDFFLLNKCMGRVSVYSLMNKNVDYMAEANMWDPPTWHRQAVRDFVDANNRFFLQLFILLSSARVGIRYAHKRVDTSQRNAVGTGRGDKRTQSRAK